MSVAERGRWEKVHTVNDFWDCPRGGVADFQGVPHVYKVTWSEERDDYGDDYLLTPIGADQMKIVLEAWSIWERWETAFYAGA